MNSRRRGVAVLCACASAALIAAGLSGGSAVAASGPSSAHTQLVSSVPSAVTPQFTDGVVLALAQVGNTVVAGGSFTSMTAASGGATLTRNRIAAFDATTGAISTTFAPNLNGNVEALLPGPVAGTVYVAGDFTTIGGTTVPQLALLRVSDGSRVTTFAPAAIKGGVLTMALSRGQLFIGGGFTKIGTATRGGLASLDPTTGAVTAFVTTGVSGHHNYGNVSDAELQALPPFPGWTPTVAKGRTSVQRLAVNPQGTRMIVIGNFDKVGGVPHDQAAMFNVSPSAATLDPNWATMAFHEACFWFVFDGYMRDVDFSPDGNFFDIATAGGHDLLLPEAAVRCDTVTRWAANGSGSDVQPLWVASSGSDSFFGVADTGVAVYGVGHPRWMNNPLASDMAGPGAVARPSLVALDPVNGMPLAWNPGREPRGDGVMAVLATNTGLWLGYDTKFMGNREYTRQRLAFLPLAGGYTPASVTTATLPATLYLGSGPSLQSRGFDGTTAGSATSRTSPMDWTTVRGAVLIGSQLFYGKSDQMLYARTFDGTSFGAERTVNPYSDPKWDNVVDAGRGTNGTITLKGVQPDFYAQLPNVTSMAFSSSTERLYYTLAGDPTLYWRAFSPDSGVLYPIAQTVAGVSMADTTGMFISGSTLWFASGSTGALSSVGLTAGGFNGSPAAVSGPSIDGVNWSGATLFAGP
ncbi:MAG: hypothetical protein ACJ71T_10090 [Actinomycetales bacterium]